jgi:hypothetical protein
LGRQAIVDRGLAELDRRGWDRYVLVSDAPALPAAVRIAHSRPEAVQAMVLGHACLEHRMDGERPTINRDVMEAFAKLAESDYRNFIRYGLTQVTHGSIGDELAARMLDRVPVEVGRALWEIYILDPEPFGELIRDVGAPLFLADHENCLGHTREGFQDAVAAFPEARTISVPDAPSVSGEFAEALSDFCLELAGSSPARTSDM